MRAQRAGWAGGLRWAGPSSGVPRPPPVLRRRPARGATVTPPTALSAGRLSGLAMLFLLLILSGLGRLTSADHCKWGTGPVRAARRSVPGRGQCRPCCCRTSGQGGIAPRAAARAAWFQGPGAPGGWRAQSRPGPAGPHSPVSALAGEGALLLAWWGPSELDGPWDQPFFT